METFCRSRSLSRPRTSNESHGQVFHWPMAFWVQKDLSWPESKRQDIEICTFYYEKNTWLYNNLLALWRIDTVDLTTDQHPELSEFISERRSSKKSIQSSALLCGKWGRFRPLREGTGSEPLSKRNLRYFFESHINIQLGFQDSLLNVIIITFTSLSSNSIDLHKKQA